MLFLHTEICIDPQKCGNCGHSLSELNQHDLNIAEWLSGWQRDTVESVLNAGNGVIQYRIRVHFLLDGVAGVDDRAVAATAEVVANLAQLCLCQFPRQIHGNLARNGDGLISRFGPHVR